VRSPSSRGRGWLAASALALGACAAPAPSLPPEAGLVTTLSAPSAADAAKSCEDLAAEWRETHARGAEANAAIAANRGHNQAVGYVAAVLFPPLALASEHNSAEKERLAELQARRDVLIGLARARSCPPL
jgi:hypothetical protein